MLNGNRVPKRRKGRLYYSTHNLQSINARECRETMGILLWVEKTLIAVKLHNKCCITGRVIADWSMADGTCIHCHRLLKCGRRSTRTGSRTHCSDICTREQYIRFRVLFVHRNLLLDEEEEDSTSISVFLVNECRCQIICHHHPIAILQVSMRGWSKEE